MNVESAQAAQQQVKKQSLREQVEKSAHSSRLFSSWMSFAIIGVWIALMQAAGVALFTKGFLLSRPVFEDHSECSVSPITDSMKATSGCWMDKSFDRAVVVIIDALRFDFVVPSDDTQLYHNAFPTLYDYSTKYPQNSFLAKFIADPPTTTLQRLKGLTTGSLPTFIDAGSNFAGTQIEEDNWINQAYNMSKTISFVGDDTWTALFGKQFQTSEPYESLNVHDLHTVDNGVIEHLFPMMRDKPDIAIGHLLGVDHAGHRYGPSHPSMKAKLEQMDEFVQNVIDKIDDKTLLVVMGDHGMDPKGDHGGDTQLELESTLWMYSKSKFFGRDPKRDYSVVQNGKYHRSVEQIDLVPTLSLLLGLPIPFNSLGFPIAEAFLGPKSSNVEQLGLANYLTAAQIRRYSNKFDDDRTENELWREIKTAFDDGVGDLVRATEVYQKYTLGQFRAKWVNFDLPYMYIGLTVLITSVVVVLAFYRQVSKFHAYSVMQTLSTGGTLGTVIGYAIGKIVGIESTHAVALGLSAGVAVGSMQMVVRMVQSREMPSWWTVLAGGMIILQSVALSSNSFTIWEDQILQFFMVSFGAITFARSFGYSNVEKRTMGMWHSAVFMVLTKLVSMSTLCREEQGIDCQSTFYQDMSSSVSHPYCLIGLATLTALFPFILQSFYETTASYNGSASLWIAMGLRLVMGLATIYWVLDGADAYGWDLGGLATDPDSLKPVKLVVARTALGAALVAANYAWYTGALCVKVDFVKRGETAKPQATILGYANVYGAFYFLLLLNVFGASLVVNKPMGGIVLCALMYHILTLLEMIDVHDLQTQAPLLPAAMLGVMSGVYFFATGHHATLPAIQWEVGFVPANTIVFPLTHIAIGLNTFAPVILTTLAAPLLTLWKVPPGGSSVVTHAKATSAVLANMVYHGCITVASVIFTMQLRRHLMLWKIFAPRYMLAGIQLVVVDVIAFIAIAACGRCVSYVYFIFG